MNKIVILILAQWTFFQFAGDAKPPNKIEIEIFNIMTGKEVEFEFNLIVEFGKTQISVDQFIERNLLMDLKNEETVKLKLDLIDNGFECALPASALKEASKLLYKLKFDSVGRWNKVYWTNIHGETFLQEFKYDISIPSNYQSLEIIHRDYFSKSIDGSDLDWFSSYFDYYPSINGEYSSDLNDFEFFGIDIKDSTNLKIHVKSENGNVEEISGTWIYKENLNVIWITTVKSVMFNLKNKGNINLNSCSFELKDKDEINIYRYTEGNGKIVKEEVMKMRKK